MRLAHNLERGQKSRILLHGILQDLIVRSEDQAVGRIGGRVNYIFSGKTIVVDSPVLLQP